MDLIIIIKLIYNFSHVHTCCVDTSKRQTLTLLFFYFNGR